MQDFQKITKECSEIMQSIADLREAESKLEESLEIISDQIKDKEKEMQAKLESVHQD